MIGARLAIYMLSVLPVSELWVPFLNSFLDYLVAIEDKEDEGYLIIILSLYHTCSEDLQLIVDEHEYNSTLIGWIG